MTDIQPPIESWKITNSSTIPITINDIPELPVLKVKQTIEALNYTTVNKLSNSPNFRNYLKNGTLSSPGYFHTHEHKDLDKLQGGKSNEYYHLSNEKYLDIINNPLNPVYRAFCNEDAPNSNVIKCRLNNILTGSIVSVICFIAGESGTLNEAVPHLKSDYPIIVVEENEKYYCTTVFNSSTTIINLNNLDDVVITSPVDGQVLKYDGEIGKWTNQF